MFKVLSLFRKTQVECDEVKINIEEKATFITIKRDMKTFLMENFV